MTIAGVVGDVRYVGLDSEPGLDLYYPEGLFPQSAITLLVAVRNDPLSVVEDIRSQISHIDKEAFVTDIQPMKALIVASLAPRHLSTLLLTVFAVLAFALSLAGLYGVIAHSVAQRMFEIGIRMALGAAPRRLVILILQRAVLPALGGIAVGLVTSLATTRLLSTMLFAIRPFDIRTWATVSVWLLAVCLLASYIPARRAARLDPVTALRHD